MDKVIGLSFTYDKKISISFPEWWKSDREANLPALMLNNIFGIIPYYDYKGGLTWVRVVNLATNETIKYYPGTENDLLYICKHILTDCKKVLREWGKEPYREFRYGIEYLRDNWHKENYPDAFQRPDVRINSIMKIARLTPRTCFREALRASAQRKPDNGNSFNHYTFPDKEEVSKAIKKAMLVKIADYLQTNISEDIDISGFDLEELFGYLFNTDYLYDVYIKLGRETYNGYRVPSYIRFVANGVLSGIQWLLE